MLTNAAVKAARPRAAAYKLADRGGLILHVAPTGSKAFRWRFRLGGKEQLLTLGQWPEVSLDQARAARDAAQARLGRGEDPRRAANDDSVPATFEPAARAWHAHRLASWTPVHAADVMASLERDVFPAIGAIALDTIDAPMVLRVLRAIEARGSVATARRVQQRIKRVFAYAQSEGWARTNPADGREEAMATPAAVRHQPALVDAAACRALLAAVDRLAAAPAAKLASLFLALTGMRLAAVRGARWCEILELDGDAPVWRVPAARMKLKAAKKLDAAHDHAVPLSPAAVAVLRQARANLHRGNADCDALIFPGRDGRAIGEGAIGALYARAGYAGRHVPHGWRASFSTILNEMLPAERGGIDQALGHVAGGRDAAEHKVNRKVEAAYNRAEHLGPRRRLFDAWAAILAGGDA